jgi:flagellar FliJ protein
MPQKRFVFRLQALLEHREQIEKEKQQVLAECLQRLSVLEENLTSRMAELQNMWTERKKYGFVNAETSMMHLSYTALLKDKIQEKKIEVDQYKNIVHAARMDLIEASKQKKALEILKENQQNEFKKAEKLKETKFLDELANMREMRKRQ